MSSNTPEIMADEKIHFGNYGALFLSEMYELSAKRLKTGTGTAFENSVSVIAFIKIKNKQL